jgi:hypothetical protein
MNHYRVISHCHANIISCWVSKHVRWIFFHRNCLMMKNYFKQRLQTFFFPFMSSQKSNSFAFNKWNSSLTQTEGERTLFLFDDNALLCNVNIPEWLWRLLRKNVSFLEKQRFRGLCIAELENVVKNRGETLGRRLFLLRW